MNGRSRTRGKNYHANIIISFKSVKRNKTVGTLKYIHYMRFIRRPSVRGTVFF